MSRLADLAKHLVQPDAAVRTSWPAVRDTCRNLGWLFDDWQDDLGRLILSRDKSGMYACSLCALSLPRQVGKTYLIGCIVFAVCLTTPGTTAIWTAHRGRTATETFRAMKAKAKSSELAPFVDQRTKGGGIRSSNGEQEIEFLNGSRILFGAREAGFGVGFADVGILVLDEIQRASVKAMDDLLPTTNAAADPLVLCLGTPPRPTDDGEVFSMLRAEAIAGESSDVLYVELGASEKFDLENESAFWRHLRKVNPSFPHRVGERAILRNKKGLSEASVYREVFGIWDETVRQQGVISPGVWSDLGIAAADVPSDDPAAFGLDMSHDRVVTIGVCVKGETRDHVELAAFDRADDPALVVEWLAGRAGRKMPVVVDSYSPAASLVPALEEARVSVHVVSSGGDMAKACGAFYDEVNAGRLSHFAQAPLDEAVAGAKKRAVGTAGGWAWDRKDGSINLAPLVAVTLAKYGADNFARKQRSGAAYQRS